ncbi:MAG: homoserine O-acetyltransferase MetX [Candidatus Helarchaeota archaeon]
MITIEFEKNKYLELEDSFQFECGKTLNNIKLAYETYGTLNNKKTNAILIFHALSGSAHAYKDETRYKGWWDSMIGPNKPFDTNKYFIICSNILGSCYGTTGPSSINPNTNRPYGMNFPFTTVHDMIKAQKYLIDYLGIKELLTITGGSLGGMMALDWVVSYPGTTKSVIPIATTCRTSAQNIGFHEVGRQAIYSDPHWNNGDYYYNEQKPDVGLSIARMIGHITYLSDKSMKNKFGRRFQKGCTNPYLNNKFQVENYLKYKGTSFTKRFDPNSYICITEAIDHFDLARDRKLKDVFQNVQAKFLVLSFSSDWLYPSYQSKELVNALKANRIKVSYCEINSDYGHDAFLLPSYDGLYEKIVSDFIKSVFEERNVSKIGGLN